LGRCENDAQVTVDKFINNGIIIVSSINLRLNSITKYILYWYLGRKRFFSVLLRHPYIAHGDQQMAFRFTLDRFRLIKCFYTYMINCRNWTNRVFRSRQNTPYYPPNTDSAMCVTEHIFIKRSKSLSIYNIDDLFIHHCVIMIKLIN